MALPESYDRDQVDAHLTQRLEGVRMQFGQILEDARTQMQAITGEVARVVQEGTQIR